MNMNIFQSTYKWRYFDYLLFGAMTVLLIFGIAMIRSAVAGNIDLQGSDIRQLIFSIAGIVTIILLASIDYHYWRSINTTLYVLVVASLILLNIIAPAIFGSARWFKLIFINIQPSEFAKIVLILVMAEFFSHHEQQINEVKWIVISLAVTMGIVIWIILQPNLSTSIVLMVIWFGLLWFSGLSTKRLFSMIGIALVTLIIALPLLIDLKVIKTYQITRITNFLGMKAEDTQYGDTYNVDQALISLGSGGWTGEGYGQGSQVQMRFLKVRHSDFIFSSIGNELGFAGCTAVIAVLVFIILRCLRAATLSRDKYGALIALGVCLLLLIQAAVNIGVNLQVLPVTGLTLPFVSYGGSSLMANMMGIGLVESVIVHHKALN
jgi:rod shape determining protein RodA